MAARLPVHRERIVTKPRSLRAPRQRDMGLGRLEGRIAIGRFLARFPDFRLAGTPERARRARFRGHLRLPALLLP